MILFLGLGLEWFSRLPSATSTSITSDLEISWLSWGRAYQHWSSETVHLSLSPTRSPGGPGARVRVMVIRVMYARTRILGHCENSILQGQLQYKSVISIQYISSVHGVHWFILCINIIAAVLWGTSLVVLGPHQALDCWGSSSGTWSLG